MSNPSFLITRPNHDLVTNYLYTWTEVIIKNAKNRNTVIYDLKKGKANKSILDSYIKKNNPNIVLFNGHGNADKITGINNEVLIEINKDEKLLSGKIIYARSCRSAKRLGISCVRNGATAFIGYKEDFILISTPEKATKPLTDTIAGYFLEPSNLVIQTLLKGNSPKESHERSQLDSVKKIKHLLSENATSEEKSLLSFLWRNMKAQVLIENNSL
ncbi:hypothetical protein KKD03_02960 [Patescibacteria group bacterium]|nr:hypothetical protein [Patescibacteria group bacterium]